MDQNVLLGGVLLVAGLGDVAIGVLMGGRLKAAARLALMAGGAILSVVGMVLSLGLVKPL